MIDGLDKVFERFHIIPNDISLYEQAFTHASYSNEHKECLSYDRLEFLGDSLLDMIVGDMLYKANPTANSGVLSRMRAALVEGRTLTHFSEDVFGFSSLVRYSQGEKDNTKFHKHIDEDVFESFIAAVYLDQGYSFVRQLILDIFTPLMDEAMSISIKRDSKSRLQELLKGAVIQYVVIKQENLLSENVCFTVEARYGDMSLGIGKGHNIKEAEINAASDAISKKVGN
jgi:ribonuclease III